MPIKVSHTVYFRTAEACTLAGITKNTFLRWVKNGSIPDVRRKDRRGWRLFTKNELKRLKTEANKVNVSLPQKRQNQNNGDHHKT